MEGGKKAGERTGERRVGMEKSGERMEVETERTQESGEEKGGLGGLVAQRTEDENVERGNWTSDLEFILACVGYAIGLGNVWRFPFLLYKHGGGFLIAYWLILFFVAFPVFFLELSLGQFTSAGPLGIFRNMVPGMGGLGWSTLWLQLPNSIYYNAIQAIAIFYAFSSFDQPWSRCSETEPWYSAPCYSVEDYHDCVQNQPESFYFAKGRCYNKASISLAYLAELEDCLLDDGEPLENKPSCQLKLTLPFNATSPADFFSSFGQPERDLPDECGRGFFKEFDQCTNAYKDWKDWNRTMEDVNRTMDEKPLELIINLSATKKGGKWEGAKKRELCLRHLLSLSLPVKSRLPHLAYVLLNFCSKTWNLEPIEVPDLGYSPSATCLSRIFDNLEVYSSQQYYQYFVQSSPNVEDMGRLGIKYNLILSLALSWFLTGFGIWKGPKITGKLVYITALFPILMVFILIFIAITLDGFSPLSLTLLSPIRTAFGFEGYTEGIKYYLAIHWCRLTDKDLWTDALSQMFFSLSIGLGGLQSLASYNRFHNDLLRDAVTVALCNCFFSFIAGFGIFGIIGHMAKQVNTPVPLIVQGGPSLTFIVMAQATAAIRGGEVFAFFFYLMIILLAIDSSFANVETIMTFVYDEFPGLRKHRFLVTFTGCSLMFYAGLPFVSRTGFSLIDHVDNAVYKVGVPLIVITALFTTFAIYGFKRYIQDVHLMLGRIPGTRFSLSRRLFNSPLKWALFGTMLVTAPIGVLGLIVTNWVEIAPGWDFHQPGYYIKFILAIVPLTLIMLGAFLWAVVKLGLRGADLLRPSPTWGPLLPAHRTGRYSPQPTTTTSNAPSPNPHAPTNPTRN